MGRVNGTDPATGMDPIIANLADHYIIISSSSNNSSISSSSSSSSKVECLRQSLKSSYAVSGLQFGDSQYRIASLASANVIVSAKEVTRLSLLVHLMVILRHT